MHAEELRTALNAVYTQRSRPPPVYTDASLTSARVKALHVHELRMAVRLIE